MNQINNLTNKEFHQIIVFQQDKDPKRLETQSKKNVNQNFLKKCLSNLTNLIKILKEHIIQITKNKIFLKKSKSEV